MVLSMLCTLCIIVWQVGCTEAYIWSYIIGQPVAEGAFDNVDFPHHENHQKVPFEQGPNSTGTNDTVSENDTQRWLPCSSDRGCGRGQFCDRHYGLCLPHARLRGACRRDGHCRKHLQCVHGRCRPAIHPPAPGARCKHDHDCGPSGCCARRHGEKLCQTLLTEGAPCYVPRGGLAYTLNEMCPCAAGLICRINHSLENARQINGSGREFTPREYLRCLPFDL